MYIYKAKSLFMENNSLLKKNLVGYSSIAAIIIASSKESNGQIIYSDLNPDVIVKPITNSWGDKYNDTTVLMDLNNNGVVDFKIHINFYSYNNPQSSCDSARNEIVPYGQNSIMFSSSGVSSSGDTIIVAAKLDLNALIGPDTAFINDDLWLYRQQGHYISYYGGYCSYSKKGVWRDAFNNFIGVKFIEGGNTYYGWVRLAASDGDTYAIRDYAYNASPGEPIQAGQRMNCKLLEPNNNFNQAIQINTDELFRSVINPSDDKDFFSFTVTDNQPHIEIILSNPPVNYNINLYDSLTHKIADSKNKKNVNDTITFNNALPGTYYVKVFNNNGLFDATNCYTLVIKASAIPFRETVSGNEFLFVDSQFALYPNPVSDKLYVDWIDRAGVFAKFSIYDLIGRKISEMKAVFNAEGTAMVDVTNLSAGKYLLQIRYDEGLEIKKFIVE